MPLTTTREHAASHPPSQDPAPGRVLLAAWDLDGQASLGEQASLDELVVIALVRDAVCRGEPPIWVQLPAGAGELLVEVHDGGGGRPVRKHAAGDGCRRDLKQLDGLIELHAGERGVIGDLAGPAKTASVGLSLAGAR